MGQIFKIYLNIFNEQENRKNTTRMNKQLVKKICKNFQTFLQMILQFLRFSTSSLLSISNYNKQK